jgi:hypothetical protein
VDDSGWVILEIENLVGHFARVPTDASRFIEDGLPGRVVRDFVNDQDELQCTLPVDNAIEF